MKMKTVAIDRGAAMNQNFAPFNSIHQHVCGFHHYSGAPGRQVRAHHYCACLNEDVMQCVIYDSDAPDAKLIGIEYIISAKLFATLPPQEQELWHSHVYEVTGGLITTPSVPTIAEKAAMQRMISTYGKTFHTWQVDRGDRLPLGIPQLMMAFTEPGQIQASLLKQRDTQYGVTSAELVRQRADIPVPEKLGRADNWTRTGKAVQLQRVEVPVAAL